VTNRLTSVYRIAHRQGEGWVPRGVAKPPRALPEVAKTCRGEGREPATPGATDGHRGDSGWRRGTRTGPLYRRGPRPSVARAIPTPSCRGPCEAPPAPRVMVQGPRGAGPRSCCGPEGAGQWRRVRRGYWAVRCGRGRGGGLLRGSPVQFSCGVILFAQDRCGIREGPLLLLRISLLSGSWRESPPAAAVGGFVRPPRDPSLQLPRGC